MNNLLFFAMLYIEIAICMSVLFFGVMLIAGRVAAEGFISVSYAALWLAILWPRTSYDIVRLMILKE